MAVGIGPLIKSGPSTAFYASGEVIAQEIANNRSLIRVGIAAYNGPSGNSTSRYLSSGTQWGGISGVGVIVNHSTNPFLPAGYAQNQLRWSESGDVWVNHDANGYLGPLQIVMHVQYDVYNEEYYGYLDVPRIAKPPTAPGAPVASAVTTTGLTMTWALPGDNNGAGLDQMLLRRSSSPDMSAYTDIVLPGGTTSTPVTGLTPGTQYYWAVYAHNAAGYSNRSGITAQATLPSTPPGISILPNIDGTQATVTLTPPGGTSGVSLYNIQYRPVGGATTATTTTTTTKVISGLAPAGIYEYRANAVIGGYTSPWTEWTTQGQPAPNTNPGDYFDGNTADKADTDYAWSAATNNSPSTATGKNVTGWMTFAQGSGTSGGTGALMQATGGMAGSFAARVTFFSDCTTAGFITGIGSTGGGDVESGATYVGSIHVNLPARTQRIHAGIAWLDASNNVISYTWGTAQSVAASNDTWTRFFVSGVAPVGAVKAAPRIKDTGGAGWSTWKGGDVIRMDAVMLSLTQLFPYFDGSWPDVPEYDYQWLGAAHASASVRYTLVVPVIDVLADPDCTSLPAPPLAPSIPSDCIEEVGLWRRYTVQVPATEVRQWSSTLPTLTLETHANAERQVRIRYFANPDGVAPEVLNTTRDWEAELILTYIPPNTVLTMDGVTQRVGAEVNGGDSVVANKLLYGTNGVPATWPELRCGIGYVITLDVPTEAPEGNLTTSLQLTQRV